MLKITSIFMEKMRPLDSRGFSLVELMIAIVLLGFIVFSLLKLFADASVLSVNPDYRNTQVMLAQELVEEIRSRRFDELSAKDGNGNWSTTLGVNTGETSSDSSTFDDVDDYNGYSQTMTAPFAGFTRSVTVSYVATGALNTPLAIPSPAPNDWTPDYKRVTVTVSQASVPNIQLVTLISSSET